MSELNRDEFAEHQGTKFNIFFDQENPVEAELVEVTELRQNQVQESFSLVFLAPPDAPTLTGIRKMEHEKLGSLEGYFQNLKQTDQQRQLSQAQKVVDEFAASDQYRYYSDVEETINNLLVKGLVTRTGDFRADLATAYDMACQLHPEVREALINERISKTEEKRRAEAEKAEADKRAKAASATRAAVSVRGAPSGPVSAPAGSKGGVRDDLAAAWDAHS
jgi:hypothetical protein